MKRGFSSSGNRSLYLGWIGEQVQLKVDKELFVLENAPDGIWTLSCLSVAP